MELQLDGRARGLLAFLSDPHARLHFSQLGEDCLLWHFGHRQGGFYVDVGCHDPQRDININAGVGTARGMGKTHLFEDGAVNTFDAALARERSEQFRPPNTHAVPTCPLSEILDRALPEGRTIDYLNVDCEGLDHEVLLSNDWSKYRPEVVSVEIHGLDLENPLANPTVRLMKTHGYSMRSHCLVTTSFERTGDAL